MAIILTDQELINAKRDIEDIGKAVNEKVIVSPRYGEDFKSIPMAMAELETAIEAAAAAGAGANGWTDLLVLTQDGSTQREKNSSFQSQIDSKATTAYVDAALEDQTQTIDAALAEQTQTVNTALSQLSTAATKFYPTLAAANADIETLDVNQAVNIGEAENGGIWYKATVDATSLTKSDYDPLVQGKNYTDLKLYNSSVGLFKSIGDSVQNSQMPVTRFTSAGVSNAYPDGTYQTVSGSGVGINVTRSGSTAIKHYFDTETFLPVFTAELEITGTILELSSEGVGIGFKNGDVFEAITYTATGNILRTTDYSHEVLASGLGGFIAGDTVKFVFENNSMDVYVNDVKKGTAPILAGSSISLGQMGFLSYIATIYTSASDPIRDYVQEEISKIPSPDPTILPQAKQYTETFVADKSLDLFKQEVEIPYSSNMSVRRYTAASTSNDYPAGTYQTNVESGVQLSVLASGSNGAKHYFTTSIEPQYFEAEFKVTHQQFGGDAIGVGFKTGNDFEIIAFSNSGNLLIINNFTTTQLQTGLGGYAVNDVLKFIYDGTKIEVFVNNAKIAEALITAGDFVAIGQAGFSQYLSSISGQAIDPIRDYVKAEIAEVANQELSKGYYSFVKGVAPLLGVFNIYTQVKNNLYVGFEVKHEYDMREEIYQDYWRIYQALFYKFENGVMQPTGKTALGIGESEFVLKTNSTKVDFTGGYHGDELVTDIKFLVDGLPVSVVANISLTACNQFEYIEKSTMHETADANGVIAGHPEIADHIKHTVIKSGGYKTHNKGVWNYSGLMTIIYHGISCIHKDVATTVFSDDTYTDQAMTGSTNNYFNAIGARLYKGRNEVNGLAVEAAAYQVTPGDKDVLSEFFVHDRSTDSKYYRKTPAGNVAIGEKHESYFECKFLAI